MKFPAVLIGLWAAAVALSPRVEIAALLVLPVLAILPLWWILSGANRWIAGFLGAAMLLPPLPIAMGNSGPHPALLVAAAGGWVGLLRLREWRLSLDGPAKAMLAFFCILLASVGSAALYSGAPVAAASLARVLMFGISVYLYFFVTTGPARRQFVDESRVIRWMLLAAFLACTFACLDFYFQFPAPAGYGAQFVWLDSGVFRRAQGLFYEASTLGNFCTFILVMIAAAASQPAGARPAPRWALAIVGALASAALVFSYSRASLIALGCALFALLLTRSRSSRLRRWMLLIPLCALTGMFSVYFLFPEFARIYLLRFVASFEYFLEEPNRILSGRLDSWRTIFDILLDHPQYFLFGIGYKTLPYSDLAGGPLVADNMYLSLLIETGLPGLLAFLWLNTRILAASFRTARSGSLFGIWIFCFWIGEMVQMLSGDLFTYWRVLPLYFWILASAVKSEGMHEHPVR